MPVHIADISLDGLPPQPALHLQPRRVNLIYGRNEHGKTRLVEFILASLFHSSAKMTLRKVDAAGYVRLSGLPGVDELRFSPRGRQKLEDFLPAPDAGLPPQLARLLVVKGAESALQANTPGGLGRSALQEYLSNQGIIDRIQERVPKNTRSAQITDGRITGTMSGELKKRRESLDRLVIIDRLFTDLDTQLSDSPLGNLTARLAELEAAAADQKVVRQHYVNRLAAEQASWQQQSDALPNADILTLEGDMREEARLKEETDRLIQSCREKERLVDDYRWLEAAMQTYQSRADIPEDVPIWVYPVLAGASLLATILLAFFGFPWASLVTGLAALLTGYLSYRALRRQSAAAVNAPENKLISTEFERRFGTRCRSMTDLQSRKNLLDKEIALLETQQEQIEINTNRRQKLVRQIDDRLSAWLADGGAVPSDRAAALKRLQQKRAHIDTAIRQVEIALKTTPAQPVSGGDTARAKEFDPQRLTDLEAQITQARAGIEAINRDKTALKQRICDVTGESVTLSLQELIPALQTARADLERTARSLTADIVAGIAVTRAMQELRAGEDTSIQAALHNPLICEPVKALTGRYERLDLDDLNIEVSDRYQTFRLDELSTGAQEQVLLGLRVGMASRLFAGHPLFLILDDAFQHSDWQRRPAMVDEMLRLAQSGWQIFYLTMDDHLRDLFLEKTPPALGDDFLYYALKE